MDMMSGELMKYHNQRVEELSRQYQDSLWQQDKIQARFRAVTSKVRSWFDGDADKASNRSGQLQPQTVRVDNN